MTEQKMDEKKELRNFESEKLPCIFGSEIKDECTVRMTLLLPSGTSKGDCGHEIPYPRESTLVEFCSNCPHLNKYQEMTHYKFSVKTLREIEREDNKLRKRKHKP